MFKNLRRKIEKNRNSKNPLWKPLVFGKDFIWAISNLELTSFYWKVLIYIEQTKNKIRQIIHGLPTTDKIMWIIFGPSCIGKSTFLKSKHCAEITNLPLKNVPIIMEKYFELSKPDNITCYLHLGTDFFGGSCFLPKFFFIYRKIMKTQTHKKAIILATSKEILLERVKKRIKKGTLQKDRIKHYKDKIKLYRFADFSEYYLKLINRLEIDNIPYIIVDCSDETYPTIEKEDLHKFV